MRPQTFPTERVDWVVFDGLSQINHGTGSRIPLDKTEYVQESTMMSIPKLRRTCGSRNENS